MGSLTLMTAPSVTDPRRLQALMETALLDSPAEEAFDRLTRLASLALEVPTALVTLVTADRQFFKSCVGLSEPWSSQRGTPMRYSLCQYVVGEARPLIFDDARLMTQYQDHPAIRELKVAAYAGYPLLTSDRFPIGSFCAIDYKPRKWSTRDLRILEDLAAATMTEIELRAARRLLYAQTGR